MRKIKICIFIFVIFMVSGCSADYNIKINDDLSINDSGYGNPTEYIYEDASISLEDRVRNVVRSNIDTLNELNYKYSVLDDGELLKFYNEFKSLEDYKKNNKYVYQQWFKNFDIEKNNGIFTVLANDFYPYNTQDLDKLVIENLNINITLPFEVLETNADIIDDKNYTYTWQIDEETKDKTIYLKFDSNNNLKKEKNNLYLVVFITILGLIMLYIVYSFYRVKKINKI